MATAKKKTTEVEKKVYVEDVKCYKFNETTFINWFTYPKDSCIKLSDEELPYFQQYVRVCDGSNKQIKPCNC